MSTNEYRLKRQTCPDIQSLPISDLHKRRRRQTVRWPTITLPSQEVPGVTVGIDYFGPLPVTPRSILLDNGLLFCSKLSHAIYQLIGVRKIATSSYQPNGNGGIERVPHTTAQMLAVVVNALQTNWD